MNLSPVILSLAVCTVSWAGTVQTDNCFAVQLPAQLKKTEYLSLKNSWKVCAEFPGKLQDAEKVMAPWLEKMGFRKKYDIPAPGGKPLKLSLWQKKNERKMLLQYQEVRQTCTEIKIGEMK